MSDPQGPLGATGQHAANRPLPAAIGVVHGRSPREPAPHAPKFRLAIGMLAGVAIAAVAIAVAILLSNHATAQSAPWSSWKPQDNGLAGEREIADQVAPFYRASPAVQLVVVTVQNISDTSSSSTQLAVRDPRTGSLAGVSGMSAVYNLCGLGQSCAISAGVPSAARLLLLRREALELALYTFKYINGIQNVVALLPPGRTTSPATLTPKPPQPGRIQTTSKIDLAVVFQRDSLQPWLNRPLSTTLPQEVNISQIQGSQESLLVSLITSGALYQQQLVQAQDGSSVLLLAQLPPQ